MCGILPQNFTEMSNATKNMIDTTQKPVAMIHLVAELVTATKIRTQLYPSRFSKGCFSRAERMSEMRNIVENVHRNIVEPTKSQ